VAPVGGHFLAGDEDDRSRESLRMCSKAGEFLMVGAGVVVRDGEEVEAQVDGVADDLFDGV
jgi:hypothetical protein